MRTERAGSRYQNEEPHLPATTVSEAPSMSVSDGDSSSSSDRGFPHSSTWSLRGSLVSLSSPQAPATPHSYSLWSEGWSNKPPFKINSRSAPLKQFPQLRINMLDLSQKTKIKRILNYTIFQYRLSQSFSCTARLVFLKDWYCLYSVIGILNVPPFPVTF